MSKKAKQARQRPDMDPDAFYRIAEALERDGEDLRAKMAPDKLALIEQTAKELYAYFKDLEESTKRSRRYFGGDE